MPALQVEDGAQVFAHFYQHRGAAEIWRMKGGYIPLVANLIGYVAVRFPTRTIPYVLTWLPLLITLAAYSLFFNRRYRTILAAEQTRAVVCVLFCLAPIAQFHLLSHTDYSIWNTFLLLILMSVLPVPTNRVRGLLYGLLMNLLVWSHPLTVLVLPFQVYLWVKDKPGRVLYTLTIVNIVVHQIIGVEPNGMFTNLGPLDIGLTMAKAGVWTLVITAKTAFRAAFGHPLFMWAEQNMWSLFVYWVLFLAIITGMVFWKRRAYRPLIVATVYFIFSVTFMSVLNRGYARVGNIDHSPRYVYIQSLAFLVLFGGLVDALLRQRVQTPHLLAQGERVELAHTFNVGNAVSFNGWANLAFAIIVLHYFLLNTQLGHYFMTKRASQSPYLYADPNNGAIVYQFFQELAQAEIEHKGRTGIWMVAEKIDDWPIEIDTRSAEQQQIEVVHVP
ncbi:MAG: hypothetical protein R2911_36945 [Caldilineaceae bacterium]